MEFIVTCTKIYNGEIVVEAEDYEEALEYAKNNLDEVSFEYGETTVDYAEPLDY